MYTLYLVCLIFGGIFIAISIFAGGHGDMDVHGGLDIHGDVDVHADLHGDTAAEFHSEGGEGIAAAARFLSLRNLIFFAAFFGLTGTLFTVLAIPDLVVLVSAVVMGLVAGGSMHKLITYLRSSEVGEESGGVADLEGAAAKVFIDVSRRQRGKISVRKGDRWMHFVAQVHEDAGRDRFKAGETVTIVRMNDGTAYIAGESFIQ
jgi:hypothetical protein